MGHSLQWRQSNMVTSLVTVSDARVVTVSDARVQTKIPSSWISKAYVITTSQMEGGEYVEDQFAFIRWSMKLLTIPSAVTLVHGFCQISNFESSRLPHLCKFQRQGCCIGPVKSPTPTESTRDRGEPAFTWHQGVYEYGRFISQLLILYKPPSPKTLASTSMFCLSMHALITPSNQLRPSK